MSLSGIRNVLPGAYALCAWALLMSGCAAPWGRLRSEAISARLDAAERRVVAREEGTATTACIAGALGLDEAVGLAMKNNRGLLLLLLEKEAAMGRVLESHSAALPRLQAGGTYTRLDEAATVDFGGQVMTLGAENNYAAEIGAAQPLFHGGAARSAVRSAQLGFLLTEEQLRRARQGTVFAVSKAYYDVMLGGRLMEVNEEAVKSAESHLADVENKKRAGAASEFDVLRAQVEVSNFRAEFLRQRNARHMALTALLNMIGVSQRSDVSLSEEMTYEPMRPVLEEAERVALVERADLLQAEAGVRMGEEALKLARSRYWPQVDAFFKFSLTNPDAREFGSTGGWGSGWTAGAAVTWPLFEGLAREGKVIQGKAGLEQAKLTLADAEERALLEVKQAVLSLGDAEQFVESQELSLARAKEGLRLVEVGFREGVCTEVQVTDARAALTRASALYYQAVYAHRLACLNLKLTMGVLEPAGVKGGGKGDLK